MSTLDPAGRVRRIGGTVMLDADISWCPPGVRRRQHIGAHLIVGDRGALLVDTGVRLHEEAVLAQLESALPADLPLSVLLTRTEMECCLNLPAIEERHAVREVWYTGGITVPRASAEARRVSVEPGTSLRIEPAPGVEVELISPLLRLLPTLWVYDPVSGALLTSDAFTHGHEGTLDANDGLVKFSWIAEADTRPIAEDVRRLVREREVTALAPDYGDPFLGIDACREAADSLAHAIEERSGR